MNKKKALLIGSSFSAVPIFFALKKRGLDVSVCGNLKADPCHQYADESFYIDYSKPEELMRLVEQNQFDYIVPSCNDCAYLSAVPVAEKHGYFGFDKPEVAKAIHTKSLFRLEAEKQSLPSPKFVRQKKDLVLQAEHLSFPLLVKPIDSFSGRGISKVLGSNHLEKAVKQAIEVSRLGEAVLEEFVEGCLHSHSAFIGRGEIVCDFFVDEFCTVYPYQVNCSNHPSSLSQSVRAAMRSAISRLASNLKLGDGLLHTQFIVKDGMFWIIECMRRCPGDLYGYMVERSTDVDYTDLYIRAFLNLELPAISVAQSLKYVGRHTVSRNEEVVPFSFSNNIPASHVETVQLKVSGEKLGKAPLDKLAILFAEFESEETMFSVSPRLADFITIKASGELI